MMFHCLPTILQLLTYMMMMVRYSMTSSFVAYLLSLYSFFTGIRFAPFEGPLLESFGKYELTVLLKGEVSTPVSVDVLDTEGKFSTISL